MNFKIFLLTLLTVLSGCQLFQEIQTGLQQTTNRSNLITKSIGQSSTYLRDNFGEPKYFMSFANFDLFYYNKYVFKTDSQRIISDYAELPEIFYRVKVESLSAPEFTEKTSSVAIVSGMTIPSDSLDFKTYTEAIRLIVSQSKKFKKMSVDEKFPDVLLVVEYFISDPQKETEIWSVPQYSYVPSPSYTTNYYGSSGYMGSSYTSGGYGSIQYSGNSVYSTTSTTYIRTLIITAIDGKEYGKSKKSKELWKVRIKSEGPTDELRQFVTDASLISYNFWGKALDETKKYAWYYKNPAFEFLKSEDKHEVPK